jgi:predicted 3-demethylubiquinone-9 3-methyltransferase (glyoxalase superfamily)
MTTQPQSPLTMLLSRHTRRRDFITLLGGTAAAWPLAAQAQQREHMRHVGVLTALAESDPGWRRNFAGFIAGLREAGWTEGQNFRFEFRYVPGGSVDHLRAAATELVALRPDVILAVTSVSARLVAEQTKSIPVVFLLSIDPVTEGLVASVARPGGNITGFTQSDFAGDVLTVEFTVAGIPCIGLNGGPAFKHNEAFSFQIATDDQQETDRYWDAIVGNGGQESECGWCKDKWGVSWQITPRALTEALAAGGHEAKRAFDAMMGMKKIDVAAIKAARRG